MKERTSLLTTTACKFMMVKRLKLISLADSIKYSMASL